MMILDRYKIGEHLFAVGRTRSGKSFMINHLIKTELKNNYVIFDVKGEDYNNLGCHVVKSISQLIEALLKKKTKILYKNEYMTKDELNKALKVLYMSTSNITIIIDEIHLFINKHYAPAYLKQFVKVGASKGKGVWCISQRGQDLHNDVLTQSTHKLAGYISYEDEQYMSKKLQLGKYGFSFDELQLYEFWYLRDEAKFKPIKVRI